MSFDKRVLEQDEQRRVATEIALRAGTLQVCEFLGIAFEGSGDLTTAYRVGNSQFSASELGDTFSSRREMTDAIKSAVLDHPADECPACEKHRGEDSAP